MREKQQKSQSELAFMSLVEVKPQARLDEGTETLAAGSKPESPETTLAHIAGATTD